MYISGEHHRNNENMDYFYQLEIWKGNINGALRVARQRDELTDWLVAMAPMGKAFPYKLYKLICWFVLLGLSPTNTVMVIW